MAQAGSRAPERASGELEGLRGLRARVATCLEAVHTCVCVCVCVRMFVSV